MKGSVRQQYPFPGTDQHRTGLTAGYLGRRLWFAQWPVRAGQWGRCDTSSISPPTNHRSGFLPSREPIRLCHSLSRKLLQGRNFDLPMACVCHWHEIKEWDLFFLFFSLSLLISFFPRIFFLSDLYQSFENLHKFAAFSLSFWRAVNYQKSFVTVSSTSHLIIEFSEQKVDFQVQNTAVWSHYLLFVLTYTNENNWR